MTWRPRSWHRWTACWSPRVAGRHAGADEVAQDDRLHCRDATRSEREATQAAAARPVLAAARQRDLTSSRREARPRSRAPAEWASSSCSPTTTGSTPGTGGQESANRCSWVKIDEHATLGLATGGMPDGMKVKAVGERAWPEGDVDLPGHLLGLAPSSAGRSEEHTSEL